MTPSNPVQKRALHPLIVTAAVAVVLFCSVAIAAIMGWLPTSMGGGAPASALTSADQLASAPPPSPSQQLSQTPPPAPQASEAAPERVVEREVPRVRRDTQLAEAKPAVCKSCGVIESVREVKTRASGSGVGAAGGAIVGGLLGNQVGGGHGRDLATVAGAIGGAVVGNQVEGNVRATTSYEITVRMNDGSSRNVHQSSAGWRSGDRVRVVNGQLRANG